MKCNVDSEFKGLVFLQNDCSDDIDVNMKSYILYIVYSTYM